ncbi:MAG TPA: GNAT family N-acetyltransferase [Bryobacteraceae bacterium]
MQIREAAEEDFEQIAAIYNEIVGNSTAIYNDRPVAVADRIAWWRARKEQGYPVLVAAEVSAILGFASFGDFRPWPGYRFTVEGTIHIHASSRGRGVGTELLKALVAHAQMAGKHIMIGGVDAENVASLRFLEKFGFERVAHLREVGYKFDRFLDLIFLQYWLTPRR